MKKPEEIYEILNATFSGSVIELITDQPTEPIIIVPALELDKICKFLFENEELQFDSLMNLSGVDDNNGQQITDESGKKSQQGGTLSVFYHLESTSIKHKILLKVSTDRDKPEVASVVDIWLGANWHEREAYDMFGFNFINHPNLTRILMPYDWEAGFPLRKDYENPEFYQGMKVPY